MALVMDLPPSRGGTGTKFIYCTSYRSPPPPPPPQRYKVKSKAICIRYKVNNPLWSNIYQLVLVRKQRYFIWICILYFMFSLGGTKHMSLLVMWYVRVFIFCSVLACPPPPNIRKLSPRWVLAFKTVSIDPSNVPPKICINALEYEQYAQLKYTCEKNRQFAHCTFS